MIDYILFFPEYWIQSSHFFFTFCVFRINVLSNNMFPPAETYPAPVGTPLISPYLQWDHSQTWDVPKADDFPSGPGGSGAATVYNIGVYWIIYMNAFVYINTHTHTIFVEHK